MGGLDLRAAHNINQASLIKVRWQLVTNKDDLWVKVIRAKYKCGNDLVPKVRREKPGSNVWKGICQNWDSVKGNFLWRVGNGASINCWRDNWLPHVGALEGFLLHTPSMVESAMRVKDLVNEQGEWSGVRISNLVPDEIAQIILKMTPPCQDKREDRVAWKLAKDGCFTSKLAYESLLDVSLNFSNPVLKLIWAWKGPERYRLHLWKVFYGILVTNDFRFRRGIASSASCSVCNRGEETLFHLLRDCDIAQQVWTFVSDGILPPYFLVDEVTDWIGKNLRDNSLRRGGVAGRLFLE